MTDEDTIRALHETVGVGTVVYRSNNSKTRHDGAIRKDTWIWTVQNFTGIEFVLREILPYMSIRRTAKIKELLEYIDGRKTQLDHPEIRCKSGVYGASFEPECQA